MVEVLGWDGLGVGVVMCSCFEIRFFVGRFGGRCV